MMQILLGLALVGDIGPNVGTTGFNFLKVAPTAREAAMGAAALGFSDNAFGIWYNPAGIVEAKMPQAGLSYISYVAGVQSGALAYVNPMKDKAFGIGAYYINSGAMKRTDDLNTDLGTFSVSYLDINPAFGWQPMTKLSVGAGLKILYGKIDSFWTLGLGADIGVKYTLIPGLQATFVAHNLGTSLKAFETQADKLPIDFGFGFGYEPVSRLRLDLEAHQPLDNKFEVRAGAEGWVSQNVCLRAGVTTAGGDLKGGGGSDILAGLSTGLGFRLKHYELDYAYTPMVLLGNSHRISFRYSFQ